MGPSTTAGRGPRLLGICLNGHLLTRSPLSSLGYLSRVAQDANLKVLAVARQLVKSGEMPSTPLRGPGTARGRYT